MREVARLIPERGGYDGPDQRFVDTWTKLRVGELLEFEVRSFPVLLTSRHATKEECNWSYENESQMEGKNEHKKKVTDIRIAGDPPGLRHVNPTKHGRVDGPPT